MKSFRLIILGLFLLAGCVDESAPSPRPVRLGWSREDLRERFGEPLRIEKVGGGGEDWFYNFVSYGSHPSGSSEQRVDEFGNRDSSVIIGWQFTRETEVRAIHVSADGHVIEPVPEGKVVPK